MSSEPINYEAVIADLEAKKAQIDAAIQALRALGGMSIPGGTTISISQPGTEVTSPSAFLGMSLPEAAKKYLSAVKRKVSTADLIVALQNGGLPPIAYNTMYGVLRRRQKQIGDVINFGGDWALAEWYPNYKLKARAAKADIDEADEQEEPKS